jgi:hypothetical protein
MFRLQIHIFEEQFDNKSCQPISGNDKTNRIVKQSRKDGRFKNFTKAAGRKIFAVIKF